MAEFADTVAALTPVEIVFVGVATDVCVTACARESRDLGYAVSVISDACATFGRVSPSGIELPGDTVHEVALAALAVGGIRVRATSAQLTRLGEPGPARPE